MHVFISWSGENSQIIANALSKALEAIFENGKETFSTFISSTNITSGAEWFNSIEENIAKSDCAILCCTPENIKAPWLNFEAGACKMQINTNANVIPFLIGMRAQELKPPLGNLHCVEFSCRGFKKLVKDINTIGNDLSTLSPAQLDSMSENEFNTKLQTSRIKKILRTYNLSIPLSLDSVYPKGTTMTVKKRVYISSPMASLSNDDYLRFQKDMVQIQHALKKYCKASIFYPGEKISSKDRFDGKQKAIKVNFSKLGESEYLLVVYPNCLASSVLTEIGYAIALSKKIIVFVKDKSDLPYILQEADIAIDNFHLYTYGKIDDIIHQISSNGTSFLL